MRGSALVISLLMWGCGASFGPIMDQATGAACIVAENKVVDEETLESTTKEIILGILRNLCDAIRVAIQTADR